ncbi:MAG: biotin--[acetyl-CoA-carboxylase] ligase [Flavobacteriaceae bacterium]|nr:biotin--[acetyl-CoA-carboxylase] ligase [Flavobacteriaceae bacterium]
MKIIRIKKCTSTNNQIKDYFFHLPSSIPLCLIAEHQTNGKGQLGAKWATQAHQNLTFSFLFPNLNLSVDKAFKINLLTTLKLYEVFTELGFSKLQFKWPNDLILANKKVGGILIENSFQSNLIKRSIVGIGINVNQTNFEGFPQAGSLKTIFQNDFSLEDIFSKITTKFDDFEVQIHELTLSNLLEKYHQNLYRYKKTSMFQYEGKVLPGIIQQVQPNGRLAIEFEDQVTKDFDVKEIKMIY